MAFNPLRPYNDLPLLPPRTDLETKRILKKLASARGALGEVSYTPPDGEPLNRDLLKNLEDYLSATDSIDPLINLGVIHYQFEAIHPFYDGNGRTGRIVNVLYLILHGLLELPILYMSSYVIKHKDLFERVGRAAFPSAVYENRFSGGSWYRCAEGCGIIS